MRNHLIAFACASFVSLATPLAAFAAEPATNDRTPCSIAAKAFDNEDLPAVRVVSLYIKNVFTQLDAVHTNNGEPGIMAQMTDRGVGMIVAAAVEFCRQHPKATIFNQAANAYQGIRAMQMQLGVAK